MTQVPSLDIQKIALATEDQEMFTPCMVGQLEAQFLKMMAQLANAKRVLDVGTFTGMSAMAFAEGLPSDGEVVTIEFDPKIASVADQLFRSSSQCHKLTLKASFARRYHFTFAHIAISCNLRNLTTFGSSDNNNPHDNFVFFSILFNRLKAIHQSIDQSAHIDI